MSSIPFAKLLVIALFYIHGLTTYVLVRGLWTLACLLSTRSLKTTNQCQRRPPKWH